MTFRIEHNLVTGETVEIPLTPSELADIAARAPTPAQIEAARVAAIDAQIAAIEQRQARAVREAALGDPVYLTAINAQIEALRALR